MNMEIVNTEDLKKEVEAEYSKRSNRKYNSP